MVKANKIRNKNKAKVLDSILDSKKTPSKKSYAPKLNVSLHKKDLISIILFSLIYYHILNNQQAFCQFQVPHIRGYVNLAHERRVGNEFTRQMKATEERNKLSGNAYASALGDELNRRMDISSQHMNQWLKERSTKTPELKQIEANQGPIKKFLNWITQKQPASSQQPVHYSSNPSPTATQRADAGLVSTITTWIKTKHENARRWKEHVKKICNFWRRD